MLFKEFQIFKATFLKLILDNSFQCLSLNRQVKYQVLTQENQKVAEEKKYFQKKKLIFKTKLQFLNYKISTCCNKSDGLSHDELKAVSSAQIVILRRTLSGRQLKKKKKRWIKIMAHLEDELYFQTTHSFLQLRNDPIRKNILP